MNTLKEIRAGIVSSHDEPKFSVPGTVLQFLSAPEQNGSDTSVMTGIDDPSQPLMGGQ
jgi:hypothetical protein